MPRITYLLYAGLDKLTKRDLNLRPSVDHVEKSIFYARQVIQPNDCILDVGAYKGEPSDTTQRYARAFPNNRVFAIEPVASLFIELERNVKNLHNVVCQRVALGDENGTVLMNVLEGDHSSSICDVDSDVTQRVDKRFSHAFKMARTEETRVQKLDDFAAENGILSIAVLKLDTQGYEGKILRGATETLKKTRFIVLEMSNHDVYKNSSKYYQIDEYLRNAGFLLADIKPSLYSHDRVYEFDSIYERI